MMSKLTCLSAIISKLHFSSLVAVLAMFFSIIVVANNPPPNPDSLDTSMNVSMNQGFRNSDFEYESPCVDEWLSQYWSFDFFTDTNKTVSDQAPEKLDLGINKQS